MLIQTGILARSLVCGLSLVVGAHNVPLLAQSPAAPADGPTSYEAEGAIDSAAVQAVVSNLGVGRHVKVETADLEFEGRILAIEESGFRVGPDRGQIRAFRSSPPIDVAFSDVRAIKSTMKPSTRVQIAAGIGIGVVLLLSTVLRPYFEK